MQDEALAGGAGLLLCAGWVSTPPVSPPVRSVPVIKRATGKHCLLSTLTFMQRVSSAWNK